MTFGIVRRLRESPPAPALPPLTAPLGAEVGAFSAVTTSGETITSLPDGTLVAFLSPGCAPCHEKLPDFVEYAGRAAVRPLAVLIDGADDPALAARLEAVVPVVVEPRDGSLTEAFQITGTPAFVTVEGGRVALLGLPPVAVGA
ncbi:TlpA family protein disulfide reductase [Bailinhaonella thermotolerans]|uniref:TlpA family protein disulfide reductase n=1 Tax=Bailinhaonella thermotolerans TaxID=1070861 RepID=UPI0011C3929E|nr:TlpA family protein disulfide reductase [Bailinhaonella thermotolerans]